MAPTNRQTDTAPLANSNAVVLSPRQWLWAGGIVAAALLGAPALWKHCETFTPGRDFRLPYRLSEDYWLYDRWSRRAANEGRLLVVGDSVVWGPPLAAAATHSHNLGVDGIHPAALAGLVRWYGRGVAGQRVVLHCNPLWMVSKRRDLRSGDKDPKFNHPRLVAQFTRSIPDYRADRSERVSICAERFMPFRKLARHVQWTRLGGANVPTWTVRHPLSDDPPEHNPTSWLAKGTARQDFPWVTPDDSLQWRFFLEAVGTLRDRGNRLFVVIGPFNEHMLTEDSLRTYDTVKAAMLERLTALGVPCAAPRALPSREYADASHPLAAGYARLAEMLRADEAFAEFNALEADE